MEDINIQEKFGGWKFSKIALEIDGRIELFTWRGGFPDKTPYVIDDTGQMHEIQAFGASRTDILTKRKSQSVKIDGKWHIIDDANIIVSLGEIATEGVEPNTIIPPVDVYKSKGVWKIKRNSEILKQVQ